MPTPHPSGGYRNAQGKKIPSVSTVVSLAKESGGLLWWAWRIAHDPLMEARAILEQIAESNGDGFDMVCVYSFLERPVDSFDFNKVRQQAADAGTVAHEMFYCFTHGQTFDPTKFSDQAVQIAEPAFKAAKEWAEHSDFNILDAEVSLVSEKHQFGGTRDGILISGKRALGDVKTSKDIYPEYLAQLGGYAILDEEAGAEIDGGYHILRFSKQEEPTDPVRFSHHWWQHNDAGRRTFLRLRELYDDLKELKRLVK